MTEKRIKDILSSVTAFPGMPDAATALLGLLDEPETPVERIEAVLQRDPGLTANVLKMSNSAFFGVPQKIGSIRQAVVLLGSRRLVQVVMASCMQAVINRSVPGYDLPSGELLRHSVAVSVAAEGLVKELQLENPDVIFTAALLHDIGNLVLGRFISEVDERVQAEADRGVSFEIVERCVLGTDHAEVGAKILQGWSLPQEIVTAVRYHHAPDDAGHPNLLTDVVHVADVLCLMAGIGLGREGLQYEPSQAVCRRLGLQARHLEKIASRMLHWTNELSELMT